MATSPLHVAIPELSILIKMGKEDGSVYLEKFGKILPLILDSWVLAEMNSEAWHHCVYLLLASVLVQPYVAYTRFFYVWIPLNTAGSLSTLLHTNTHFLRLWHMLWLCCCLWVSDAAGLDCHCLPCLQKGGGWLWLQEDDPGHSPQLPPAPPKDHYTACRYS